MVRIIAFLVALAALQFAAFAQGVPDAGQDTGRAAEAVAARAAGTFEPIDPDSEMPAADDAAAVYAGLPPLTGARPAAAPALAPAIAAKVEALADGDADAPRGPAVRMISNPVVQALPAKAPAPAPAAKPAALAPAPKPAAPKPAGGGFVIKSILPIEGTIRYGDWFWDESAAPARGPLVITVDLDARVISAFRDGHEIGTAVVLVGTQDHPTPLGTFPILTKERNNVSEKYNNAPMPWTLRLTWDGIAIHGSPVLNGYASHGCIGIPDEFAAKLFAAAKRGDKVIITRGRMVGLGDKIL
ncbi:MAG: L,D-transpeptidase family protein [Erythrobacter sp.]|uniref:L,D-transpeptidase family protein n=1 Tax=Erythrobacter sp. TaxID=1042 RepID=UPI0025CD1221|nr:L,D-transpeptidase family protein [Erythrobacter sp.]MCM0000103.1 L,D-transpeptidase family protein [Erythrobacter sp.]